MQRIPFFSALAIAGVTLVLAAQETPAGPYKLLKAAKVGGAGGFDYVYADAAGRRLYIPRTGTSPRITVFNLDTLEPAGEIPNASAHGAAVSSKSNHGFATSKPVAMWDSKTLATIKTIDVEGNPDGLLHDPFNDRVYILSHRAPHATVINAADGSIAGTIDLGGAPEQAASRWQRPHLRRHRRQGQHRRRRRQDHDRNRALRRRRERRHLRRPGDGREEPDSVRHLPQSRKPW